jgi:CheY-like chemotaxis protein
MTQLHRLLIVDDDKTLRETLLDFFMDIGHQVYEADSALAALEFLQSEPIDIILCDIRMPEIDGIEFLERHLKSEHRHIPVVFMSGYNTNSRAEILDHGAHDLVVKPFNPDALNSNLESTCQSFAKRVSDSINDEQKSATVRYSAEQIESMEFGLEGFFVQTTVPLEGIGNIKFEIQDPSSKNIISGVGEIIVKRLTSTKDLKEGFSIKVIYFDKPSRQIGLEFMEVHPNTSIVPLGWRRV